MKLLVCGGRHFGAQPSLFRIPNAPHVPPERADMESWILHRVLDATHAHRRITLIVNGGATGADFLSSQWADANGVHKNVYKADWKRLGRKAGPIRNGEMLLAERPDMVLAFPGGEGTDDCVHQAVDDPEGPHVVLVQVDAQWRVTYKLVDPIPF